MIQLDLHNREWKLVKPDGTPAKAGDTIRDFRGEKTVLHSGQPPAHPASTGRVYVQHQGNICSYFPSVYNLKWIRTCT